LSEQQTISKITPARPTSFNYEKDTPASTNIIVRQIYVQIIIVNALNELRPVSKARYTIIDCPKCKRKHKAYIYHGTGHIFCNTCDYQTSLWDYYQKKHQLTNKETLEMLAKDANYELPEPSENLARKIETANKSEEIIHCMHDFFTKQLWEPVGAQTLQYLRERFSNNDIQKMKLGHNPGFEKTMSYMYKEHHCMEHTIADVFGKNDGGEVFFKNRNNHPITFLDPKPFGKTAIWGRTLDPKIKCKYMPYLENTRKNYPFGLYAARHLKELIIVEGYLDQKIAEARGLRGVIATCGTPTKDHINEITAGPCKYVYLSFDNDKRGEDFTEIAINLLIKSNITIFIVSLPEGYKDLGEFIPAKGVEAFQKCLKNAQDVGNWLAKRIFSKYEVQSDVGRRKAIDEAINWFKRLKDPVGKEIFKKQISKYLDIPSEKWDLVIKEAKRQGEEQQYREECRNYIEKCQKLVDTNHYDEIVKLKKPQLLASEQNVNLHFVNELEKNYLLEEAPEKPALVKIIDKGNIKLFIPKGIVGGVIGAGGIGKTHFLTQLALSIVLGKPFLEIYTMPKKGNVALLLGENTKDDIHRLLRKIVKDSYSIEELQEAAKKLAVMSCSGKNASFIHKNEATSFYKELMQYLKDKEPENGWDLIILDPISRFLGADAENDNAAATQFISLLEKIIDELSGKPTILFGHHMSKAGFGKSKTDQTASRGSSALTDGIRWQANLDKVEDEIGACKTDQVCLRVVKSNHTKIYNPHILKKGVGGKLSHLEILTKNQNLEKPINSQNKKKSINKNQNEFTQFIEQQEQKALL